VFYRYEAPDGRIVIVDSASKLPPAARDRAERIDMSQGGVGEERYTVVESTETEADAAPGQETTASFESFFPEVDSPSFGLGLGSGLLIAALLLGVATGSGSGRFARKLFGFALACGIGLVLLGGYFGYLRHIGGGGEGGAASPQQLVEDAREAVEDMNQRQRERDEQLGDVQQLAR
jgi:hypothetical protein